MILFKFLNSKLTENLDKLTKKLKIDQHKGFTFNRFNMLVLCQAKLDLEIGANI